MGAALLQDRGLLRVSGAGARDFLQGLVTCNLDHVTRAHGAYGALLSPQGKVLFDFFIAQRGDDDLWIDAPASMAADLAKRLGFYRLRAKIDIETLGEAHDAPCVAAFWEGARVPDAALAHYADPRDAKLGTRAVMPAFGVGLSNDAGAYDALRIKLGVPKGGVDFAYGEAFPHECNLDRLHGVDFKKGCYVGQEVVSRVEHRGTARKRVARVEFGGPAPAVGAAVMAGDVALGVMGSSVPGHGLAMLRLDKVEEAVKAGVVISAGATALRVVP